VETHCRSLHFPVRLLAFLFSRSSSRVPLLPSDFSRRVLFGFPFPSRAFSSEELCFPFLPAHSFSLFRWWYLQLLANMHYNISEDHEVDLERDMDVFGLPNWRPLLSVSPTLSGRSRFYIVRRQMQTPSMFPDSYQDGALLGLIARTSDGAVPPETFRVINFDQVALREVLWCCNGAKKISAMTCLAVKQLKPQQKSYESFVLVQELAQSPEATPTHKLWGFGDRRWWCSVGIHDIEMGAGIDPSLFYAHTRPLDYPERGLLSESLPCVSVGATGSPLWLLRKDHVRHMIWDHVFVLKSLEPLPMIEEKLIMGSEETDLRTNMPKKHSDKTSTFLCEDILCPFIHMHVVAKCITVDPIGSTVHQAISQGGLRHLPRHEPPASLSNDGSNDLCMLAKHFNEPLNKAAQLTLFADQHLGRGKKVSRLLVERSRPDHYQRCERLHRSCDILSPAMLTEMNPDSKRLEQSKVHIAISSYYEMRMCFSPECQLEGSSSCRKIHDPMIICSHPSDLSHWKEDSLSLPPHLDRPTTEECRYFISGNLLIVDADSRSSLRPAYFEEKERSPFLSKYKLPRSKIGESGFFAPFVLFGTGNDNTQSIVFFNNSMGAFNVDFMKDLSQSGLQHLSTTTFVKACKRDLSSLGVPTLPCPTSRVPLLLSDFSRRAVKDVNGVAERYLNVLPPWKHKTWLGGKQVYEDSPSEGVINAVYSGGLLLRAELACLFLLTASSVTFLPSVAAILLAHRANVAHPNTAKLDTKDLELVAKKCIEKSETDANYFSRLSPEEKQRTFKAWDTIDKQAMAWDLAQVVFQLPLSSPMLKCEGEAKHRLMRGVLMCLYEPLCNLQVAAAMCVVPQGDGQGSQPARFQT
jgi:hypothetical protein